jgi:hypothetical protein
VKKGWHGWCSEDKRERWLEIGKDGGRCGLVGILVREEKKR